MYRIEKEFHFSAAHHLVGLEETHPCSRPHGHNYVVVVELQSDTLDEHGFVRDYNDLKRLGRYIDENLDHRDLNEVVSFQTTAENLARHLYFMCVNWWPEVVAVRVSETPKTWATYTPGSSKTWIRMQSNGVQFVIENAKKEDGDAAAG